MADAPKALSPTPTRTPAAATDNKQGAAPGVASGSEAAKGDRAAAQAEKRKSVQEIVLPGARVVREGWLMKRGIYSVYELH